MAQTIKLIRHRSGFVNVDDSFELDHGGHFDEIEASLDEYVLPDGYRVGPSPYVLDGDMPVILSPSGDKCDITMHRPTKQPQLIDCSGGGLKMPILQRAQSAAA